MQRIFYAFYLSDNLSEIEIELLLTKPNHEIDFFLSF